MLPPGLDEIVLVEPQGDGDRVPETVETRFAEDLRGPTRVGCRDDGPGDGTAQDHFLSQRRQLFVLRCHPTGVETAEEVRFRTAGELDEGGVGVAEVPKHLRLKARDVLRVSAGA
jgi:hypothetical protein